MNLMGKDAELLIQFVEDEGDLTAFTERIRVLQHVHNVVSEGWECRIRHPEDVILIDAVLPLAAEHGLSSRWVFLFPIYI